MKLYGLVILRMDHVIYTFLIRASKMRGMVYKTDNKQRGTFGSRQKKKDVSAERLKEGKKKLKCAIKFGSRLGGEGG